MQSCFTSKNFKLGKEKTEYEIKGKLPEERSAPTGLGSRDNNASLAVNARK